MLEIQMPAIVLGNLLSLVLLMIYHANLLLAYATPPLCTQIVGKNKSRNLFTIMKTRKEQEKKKNKSQSTVPLRIYPINASNLVFNATACKVGQMKEKGLPFDLLPLLSQFYRECLMNDQRPSM